MTQSPLIGPTAAPDLHVMSLNVRRRMPINGPRRADRWDVRAPALAAILTSEHPHLLGAQEVLPEQDRFIRGALGSAYRRVGRGRNARAQGEGCPIYYDSSRLELIDVTQEALSDTPEVAGSRTWGNLIPRILIRATFRDSATGIGFVAINTHFDHLSRRSRVRSARTIRDMVGRQSLPAVVTGDLNCGAGSTAIDELFTDGTLVDTWNAARARLTPEWGTFPNYGKPRLDRDRIDWIGISPGVVVDQVGINGARPDGVWASDHLPVQAVLRFTGAP